MIRWFPWHHFNFHYLQPAPLCLSSGPGPMAAVSGALTQLPDNHEVEIRALVSELFTTV